MKSGFRLHTRHIAGNAAGLERFLNQLRVPRVVFQIENPQGRFHLRLFLSELPGGGSLITAQKHAKFLDGVHKFVKIHRLHDIGVHAQACSSPPCLFLRGKK